MTYKGTVKWFNAGRGYGFLECEEEIVENKSHEIFVHFSDIKLEGFKTLQAGDAVSFEATNSKGRFKAVNVVPHKGK